MTHMLSRAAAPIAIACLLTACAGPASVGPPYRSPATWSEMIYTAAHGPMLLQVAGDPFGIGTAPLAAAAAAEMSNQVLSYPFNFTTDPAQAPQPTRRVVMVFNAPPLVDYALCNGPFTTAPPTAPTTAPPTAPGRIDAQAAFCDGPQRLSSVHGWVEGPARPDDPRFAALMGDMTRQLFGNNSEVRGDRGGMERTF